MRKKITKFETRSFFCTLSVDHMRHRNPKPYKYDESNGAMMHFYPEMDSNDYDDSDMSPMLRVQTEMLSSPPPLAPTTTTPLRLQVNRDILIDIPEMDYSGSGSSSNQHRSNRNIINSTKQQLFHQTPIKLEYVDDDVDVAKLMQPKNTHINGNDHQPRKRQRSVNVYNDDNDDGSSLYGGSASTNDGRNGNNVDMNGQQESKKRKTEEIVKDDDYHFLMSMQPYMKQLRDDQKLKIRMKMQKLIFRELYGDGDGGSGDGKSRDGKTGEGVGGKNSENGELNENEKKTDENNKTNAVANDE